MKKEDLNLDVFKTDPLLIRLVELTDSYEIELVGGAVIDLLENRTPKDYDFRIRSEYKREQIGNMEEFNFVSESKTATTYLWKGKKLQFLKVPSEKFDFTISQASVSLPKFTLDIDMRSFRTKNLIPTEHSLTNKSKSLEALRRLPHFKRKGYTLPDVTYQSLLTNSTKKTKSKYETAEDGIDYES